MDPPTIFCGTLLGKHCSTRSAAGTVEYNAGWDIAAQREVSVPAIN